MTGRFSSSMTTSASPRWSRIFGARVPRSHRTARSRAQRLKHEIDASCSTMLPDADGLEVCRR
jgi:hypothetical protein